MGVRRVASFGGREYARVLSVAAACAPAEGDITMFSTHAAGAIAVERSLHELVRPLRPELRLARARIGAGSGAAPSARPEARTASESNATMAKRIRRGGEPGAATRPQACPQAGRGPDGHGGPRCVLHASRFQP